MTRFSHRLAATLMVAWAVGCSSSPTTATVQPATGLPEFADHLERLRTQLFIPGMQAAIGKDGQVAWQHSFGLADLSAGLHVADTTTFHLASLTKQYATVVLLRLVDSGLVSLDDPISKYGVSFVGSGPVRVRHLLSMTSSGTPGQQFLYDGDRFALLGQVIARAAGRSFADLANAWILQPLGLHRTAPNVEDAAFAFSGLSATAYRATVARGYAVQGGKPSPTAYPTMFSVSAGMMSTAAEVVRFSQALDAGSLLSAIRCGT